MKIGDEVYVHGYVDEIRNDVVIIRNEGGYFGTVESEVKRAEQTEPNCSEKPNNCEDEDIFEYCPRCGMRILVGKPKDEPQTDYEKIVWHKDCGWK